MKQTSLKKLLEKIRDMSLEYPLSIQSQLADAEKKIMDGLGRGMEEAPEGLEQILGQAAEQRQKAGTEDEEKMHTRIKKNLARITGAAYSRLKRLAREQRVQGCIEDFITHETIFAAYDKKSGRIRKYVITSLCYGEDSSFETIAGSGADSAELELMKLLPGVRLKERTHPEIAFFTLCAYVRATQNVGVGGMPKIALISKERTRVLNRKESVALANITSAYQAELVSRAFAEQSIEYVIEKNANYDDIAEKMGMTHANLCGLLSPMDNWLAYANAKRYGKTSKP